ncbi:MULTISPECIES: glycosyltransferase family 2 protein [Mycobacterium avium complex (MAC)]|uniref:Transferase n=4 Tax=Mycobacterium avium complex (MAC) TaxID=120793 RepID=A0ABX3TRK8_9MYCO|nr:MULTISPECIES: glycosyltransferase [Mycobacterium avium complex (MAC)]ETA94981.1 transferase [Mycobacterium avium 05-4293]EUA36023.1 glycosyl transferase 2 family protein [Mycobacterium avium subsp. avium 2285 (R)]TXA40342.1 transferase [Mycobacterium tuberculosis variant bovis]ABK68772.1 transferase [Mycobacterium avium 104]ETZ50223.1 glycosyl transferase 2 family protein [Mycobacterium avium MAV_061107_1842]
MSTMPRTSFVIATRDRSAELTGTLTRLLDTTECPIIVVDNASRDDSVAAASRIAAAGRVTVIPLSRNAGAAARNIGVARCGTPYVAFCDDDSWWAPDAIARAEQIFDTFGTVALLAARTVLLPARRDDEFTEQLAHSPLGHRAGLPGPSILGFQACSALVRAWAFRRVGGFSPILHFRGEETLLACDLAADGWDLCFCPELVAYHRPSQIRSASRAQRARILRNALLTACLRRPVDRCARAGAALAWAALHDAAHAKALLEATAALPAALRERRRLPDAVERSLRMLESG